MGMEVDQVINFVRSDIFLISIGKGGEGSVVGGDCNR